MVISGELDLPIAGRVLFSKIGIRLIANRQDLALACVVQLAERVSSQLKLQWRLAQFQN